MEQKKVAHNMQHLLHRLDIQNEITTPEAMELLQVSEATARRLFAKMAQNGSAVRTFGGIRLAGKNAEEYNYDALVDRNRAAKLSLALRAVSLVRSKDILFLDGGTTLALFAAELARRIRGDELKNVSVFTNSLSTLKELHDVEGITLLGGRFRSKRQDFCGHLTETALRQLHFSKCFLGTDAIEADRGFTTTDFETAQLNSLVLHVSKQSYVLADASKFGETSLTPFSPASGVSAVITEETLPSAVKGTYEAAGFRFRG